MIQNENDIYEWKSEEMMNYHLRQLEKPYRSTVHFEKFLSQYVSLEKKKVIDIACGTGGATKYLANLHSSSNFLGIDFNENFKEYFTGGGIMFGLKSEISII